SWNAAKIMLGICFLLDISNSDHSHSFDRTGCRHTIRDHIAISNLELLTLRRDRQRHTEQQNAQYQNEDEPLCHVPLFPLQWLDLSFWFNPAELLTRSGRPGDRRACQQDISVGEGF